MNPIKKAIWRIESGLSEELTLDGIAAHAGVSRFYLARGFAAATNWSVMGYVRARRLSNAARALAGGASDILSVALDAGYGSHEAFTRAFREHFGHTPEAVRAAGTCAHLTLTEPLPMHQTNPIPLAPPREYDGPALLLAGFSDRFHHEQKQGIPVLWQRFGPHLGSVPGQVGHVAYGAVANSDDAGNFEYFAAVEVSSFDGLPSEYARLRVPAQHYVVFTHSAHISAISSTFAAIWGDWIPKSGREVIDAPVLEVYREDFNAMTGTGNVEIWIPMKAK